MAVSLRKGGSVNLTKESPDLKNIMVELGWKEDIDLDVSAFLLGRDSKVTKESNFVFYGNKADDSGAVFHHGDKTTGETEDGDGEKEEIEVNLEMLPGNVASIVFVVTIFSNNNQSINFSQISGSYISLKNIDTDKEIVRYELDRMDESISCVFGKLTKDGTAWSFNAVGQGFEMDLADICNKFGVEVE